jgi:hypothetical protein
MGVNPIPSHFFPPVATIGRTQPQVNAHLGNFSFDDNYLPTALVPEIGPLKGANISDLRLLLANSL